MSVEAQAAYSQLSQEDRAAANDLLAELKKEFPELSLAEVIEAVTPGLETPRSLRSGSPKARGRRAK